MGFRGESKTLKIRSKGIIAREIFEQTALSTVYAMNEGAFYRKDTTCFRRLVSPAEYIANTTHIMASLSKGANATSEIGNTGTAPNYRPASNNSRNDENSISLNNIYDMSEYSQIRGYLQPLTLTEYLTAIKAPQSASRTYISCSPSSPYYTDSIKILLDADKKPVNEISTYGNKIVPMITWYYYNRNGARVSDRQILCIAKWYTSNKYDVTKYKRQQIPFGGGYQDTYYGNHIVSSDTIYYSVTVPYVTSSTGDTYKNNVSQGTSLNGFLYSQWGTDGTVTAHIKYNDNPLYTMLCAGWDLSSVFKGATVPVSDAGFGAQITSQDGVGATGVQFVPVFDSVDDIIRLFDDFGVIVTTDWDEVLTPTPTPEESATPNPDPTDREISNFPDNTTDYTPIEPAYITPSTFGQSCVYTPTTTRDFLTWVCDNNVDVGNWARLFANPVDVITGINLYNLDIVAHDAAHVEQKAETNILGVTTPIPNYAILGGYNNIVDGGTLHLQAYYGNYADFTSMTYQMYVPFVGFTTLRACDVVNKTLHLYYAVDFATGSAVAFVNSDDKLIYTSPCTVAGKIPLSTSDRNSQMINNTLSVLGGLSGLLGGVASGNVGGGVGALMGGLGGLQMQTNYSNKGSLSSVNIYKLIPAFIERTRYDLFFPSNDSAYINAKYQTAAGAPSTQFDTLLNCVDAGGFVQSDVVYLTSQTATETEKQQIIDLIKSGIYL